MKFSDFVMTSQGNHDNHCLFSMIFLLILMGATKFKLSRVMEIFLRAPKRPNLNRVKELFVALSNNPLITVE